MPQNLADLVRLADHGKSRADSAEQNLQRSLQSKLYFMGEWQRVHSRGSGQESGHAAF
jgi:hypothetical protein